LLFFYCNHPNNNFQSAAAAKLTINAINVKMEATCFERQSTPLTTQRYSYQPWQKIQKSRQKHD
jgi:invasion protein IalB